VIQVLLLYPNGQRQEILLAGIPRVGERIRLDDSKPTSSSLIVEQVLWVEGTGRTPDPEVILSVRKTPGE
jgi:hypothetical protein